MKILHVIETLAPNYGGPVTVVNQMTQAQTRAGMEVEILTTNADMPTGRYHAAGRAALSGGSVPVNYCDVEIGVMRISSGIARFLHRFGPGFDLIHVHGLYRFPQTYAARYARKLRKPYVITVHGALDPFLYARSSRSVAFKRLYEKLFDMPNLNGATAIHFTSEDERDLTAFLKLHAPSFVIPNGLDFAPYESLPPRGALRARFGLSDAPLVLFLGRLHHKKGLDILVDALDRVRRQIADVRLLVAGPEPDYYGLRVREQVARLGLADHVIFCGPIYGADVTQAYVDADIFALPSYTENFGMTVVEALACRTPVVISDQVNIHIAVSSAQAGIVTHCDALEVAQALTSLLEDSARRAAMGEAGRALVQERYSWPMIVKGLRQEYERCIDRAGG